jgi:serine/threonine protein phosphatase 1
MSDKRTYAIGDYVDRGPDSRSVINYLIDQANPAMIALRGNHEQMMVDAMSGKANFEWWLDNGGDATINSYHGRKNVPQEHLDWMAALPVIATDDHRAYVHAGVHPDVPLEDNGEDTCMWIRERFLREKGAFPKHIVHGHTPVWACKPNPALPELLYNRTNLDTKAFHTGVLTVGVFDPELPGGPIEVLEVRV